MVANKRGECLVRVDIYNPCELHFDNVPVKVKFPSFGLREFCEELFKKKVKNQPFKTIKYTNKLEEFKEARN